eukprot:scaffold288894_cov26-Tisochrysis_lutea.AAC.1
MLGGFQGAATIGGLTYNTHVCMWIIHRHTTPEKSTVCKHMAMQLKCRLMRKRVCLSPCRADKCCRTCCRTQQQKGA